MIRENGVMTMASAGHPYPVLYSTRYGRCDRLPVRGPLLPAPELTTEMRPYRVRHAEIGRGDVVVLVSDGITEGGPVADPYGYRFTEVVERHATEGAGTYARRCWPIGGRIWRASRLPTTRRSWCSQ